MRGRYVLITVPVLILTLTLGFGVGRLSAAMGTLDSPAVPAATLSYTLQDIWSRLATGAAGAQSTFTEPATGPGPTMHTLNDIMGIAPAADNTNGATTANVLNGMTFWGLNVTAGQWGPQTGTMPNNGAVNYTPGTSAQNIAAGYHNGLGQVAGDADLLAGNIKTGVNIFGVNGSVIQATGNAAAGNVLTGKTFSNASAAGIAGTMPNNAAVTITPGTSDQAIAAGYHNGSGKVLGDPDLVSANIKCGVTIFGVNGSILPECVAKTGQTTWYADGDDGDYQKGCLPAVAPALGYPFGGYNRTSFACSAGFTDNGNGTVTDNLTGLIWLKNANCFGTKAWANALSAANTLNSGECSLSDGSAEGDWRLPNVNELRSLFDPNLMAPYLPAGHPFINVQSDYWSSTTYAPDTSIAWYVTLYNARTNGISKPATLFVWPVRGGQ